MYNPVIEDLKSDENYHGQFVRIFELPGETYESVALPQFISEHLRTSLKKIGISSLYSHQLEVIEHINKGENVIITTNTSSGKTLAFNIPIVDTLIKNPLSTSLYLYPTKALTQDQLEKFKELKGDSGIETGVYDGDTPREERTHLRKYGRVIFGNPDILHFGILPNHMNWSSFFSHLQFIVIDEAHYYSGVLGSHMSEVIRRLRRVCNYYGAHPQFILASATLNNPEEFAFNLVGERFALISKEASHTNKKTFVLFNPELIEPGMNLRKSAYKEAVWVIKRLMKNNLKSIVFVKSRKGVELLTRMLKNNLDENEKPLVSSYRAGYTVDKRREIEKNLKDGSLHTVITTNALELGIDIGSLDATVIVGYPGSISSIMQQSGRSGRKGDSLTVFITSSNPIDQYFAKDPMYIFENHYENLTVNPHNPYIELPHLKCAAYEIPIDPEVDDEYFGQGFREGINLLKSEGYLEKRLNHYFYVSKDAPHPSINLRTEGEEQIDLIDDTTNITLERISRSRAIEEAFPGAVYLHLTDTYIVKELNLLKHFALLTKEDSEYYTDSLAIESIWIEKTLSEKRFHNIDVSYGDVLVQEIVRGFVKKQFETDKKIGTEILELPDIKFHTKALWFTMEQSLFKRVLKEGEDIPGTIHAVEHSMVGIMPLIVVCDRNDLGGVSHPLHPDTGLATIFVYDGIEGGVGLTEKGYEHIEELLTSSLKSIASCPCKDGCPSCIYSPKCGNENSPLSKKGAIILLEDILK
ncbi:MAG: DEAD/DEAH box helicase [Caldisericaceae bacterium]